MSMTLTEKILARASGRPSVKAGDNVWVQADILMTHVLSAASTDQAMLKPHPHVSAYLARCLDRPAWKRVVDAYEERVEAV